MLKFNVENPLANSGNYNNIYSQNSIYEIESDKRAW